MYNEMTSASGREVGLKAWQVDQWLSNLPVLDPFIKEHFGAHCKDSLVFKKRPLYKSSVFFNKTFTHMNGRG